MKTIWIGILFLLFSAPISKVISRSQNRQDSPPIADQQTTWDPGQYRGWLYFLAKDEWSQQYALEDITGNGKAYAYFESHSDLSCAVQTGGSGTCKATLPMDFTVWQKTEFFTKECSMFNVFTMQTVSLDDTNDESTMKYKSFTDEFSIKFAPVFGLMEWTQFSGASMGAEGCSIQNYAKALIEPYTGKFPARMLNLRVGRRTALIVEGSCSMEGLPRIAEFPMGEGIVYNTNLSLLDCRWMVFRTDVNAVPPEGGQP